MALIDFKRTIPAAALALAMAGAMTLGVSTSAQAQTQSEPETQVQPEMDQAPEIDVSQQDLEAFASAAVAVDSVLQEWQPRLAEAETAEEAATIQEEAADEATRAVESEGLSVEEYQQINQAVQMDPELQQQVVQMIEERQ